MAAAVEPASAISEQSRINLARAFEKAARASLVRATEDSCEIAPGRPRSGVPEQVELQEPQNPPALLVVTISSFAFRLLTIFHVPDNPAVREYFAAGTGDDRQLAEAFSETANLCCGALTRELSAHFPHRAMSSPYVLHGQCVEFMEALHAQYLASFEVTIKQRVGLTVTLCMYCSGPVEILGTSAPVEPGKGVVAGEIDMF